MYYSAITATFIILASAPLCWSDEEASQEPDDSLEQVRNVQVALSSNDSPIRLIETPLLRFGEPARGNVKGSLWAWGRTGRPLVIAELFHNFGEQDSWVHVMTLTSDRLVTAETTVGRWMPQSVQLKMKPITESSPPADRRARRLLQMRQILRRYNAHEFWDPNNSRYELRLLPSPLHRYEDVEAGIIDGGVFAFANGTNPEILVFIEAHRELGTVHWKIGFTPSGSAEMHVTSEGSDIWSLPRAPGVTGRPSDPYWLYTTTPAAG